MKKATLKKILKNGHCKVKKGSIPKWKGIKRKQEKPSYDLFFRLLRDYGIKRPVSEYKFHRTRKWRIDFAWVEEKLALEIEGGAWIGGRHNRPDGFIKDMEKYNQINIYRFHLLRVLPDQMQNGEAAAIVNEFFSGGK